MIKNISGNMKAKGLIVFVPGQVSLVHPKLFSLHESFVTAKFAKSNGVVNVYDSPRGLQIYFL